MKAALLAVFFVFTTAQAFAAPKKCVAQEDKVSCMVIAGVGDNAVRQEINFSVFSSTFLCDGRNNRFFAKDFPIAGTNLKAFIYAGWESYRLSLLNIGDDNNLDAIAETHHARPRTIQPMSSISGSANGIRYQISCETVENTTEK